MRLNVEKSGNLRTADEADNNFNNADNKVKDFLKFSFIHTIKKIKCYYQCTDYTALRTVQDTGRSPYHRNFP